MTDRKKIAAQRRSLLWRIHFWAALIASPFALAAAFTGLMYVFVPQVEGYMHGHLDRVKPAAQVQPLDAVVQAAKGAAPEGWRLHSVVPMHEPTDSVKVAFMPPPAEKKMQALSGHAGHDANAGGSTVQKSEFLRPNFGLPNKATVVYVNPYTAEVLGSLANAERYRNWSRKLHSNYLQNDSWRWLIELAASWLMVMLITGIYLWWPTAKQAFLPEPQAKGRMAWKQWHAFVGLSLSVMSAVILTTGLTWSKQAGEQIRWARDVTAQTPPRIPAHFKSTPVEEKSMLSWEQAYQAVKQAAPDTSMQLMPPKGPEGFWRANQIDSDQPTRRFDLLLDMYSGETLYFSGWDQQTLFGKATAIGIPFHRGEFGVWNQVLLFVFGVGIVFSIISGWMTYFKRRQQGMRGLPEVMPGAWKSMSIVAWLATVVMMVAMPLLAMSAAVVVLIEGLMVFLFRKSRVH